MSLKFTFHSGVYTIETEQLLPLGLSEAWDFFSSPANLAEITPPHMGFKITSGKPPKMYPGQLITYQVAVLPGIKTNWVTEITHVEDQYFFVDEQRFGPYRMWHHEHRFEVIDSQLFMTDKVTFKLPFGILGRLAYSIFIKNQLKGIFEYRTKKLDELFHS